MTVSRSEGKVYAIVYFTGRKVIPFISNKEGESYQMKGA